MIHWWIAGAVLIILVLRRVQPLLAAALGVALTIGIAGWGIWSYNAGIRIALAGFELTRPVFLGIIAIWFALEVHSLVTELRRRKNPEPTWDNEAV